MKHWKGRACKWIGLNRQDISALLFSIRLGFRAFRIFSYTLFVSMLIVASIFSLREYSLNWLQDHPGVLEGILRSKRFSVLTICVLISIFAVLVFLGGQYRNTLHKSVISSDQVRIIAERLSQQRPWKSPEENWFDAERALRQKPWRPFIIHFSGDKERSGWEWTDLLLKLSVPVLILGLSTAFSNISANRQEKSSRQTKEGEALSSFITEMRPVIVQEGMGSSKHNKQSRGFIRGLVLATLSQLKEPEKKRLVIKFLLDNNLNVPPGSLISLSEASLAYADLAGVTLTKTNLRRANLNHANLRYSSMRYADLIEADLNHTDFRGANLEGAQFRGDAHFVSFKGANLNHASLQEIRTHNADFREASINHATLIRAGLSGARLQLASLQKSNLRNADLTFAKVDGANLLGASLRGAKLNGAVFKGADLRHADLSHTDLTSTNLQGADLRGANLSDSVFKDTRYDEFTRWPKGFHCRLFKPGCVFVIDPQNR